MKQVSIVATMYQSQKFVQEFYDRSIVALHKIGVTDYEFVLVDDGSPDQSLEAAIKLHELDQRVKVIELSRNFGHHKAIFTGLAHSEAEYVFLVDIDLEEEPELLVDFWEVLHSAENQEVDVVYGVQHSRKGGVFERISGGMFYRLFNFFSGVKIPRDLIIARLMKKPYVEALVQHQDHAVFFAGLSVIAGFCQIPFVCHKKHKGETTYNLTRKLSQAVNSVASFTAKPLYYIFFTGLSIFCSSLLYVIYLLVNKAFFSSPIDGWTSVMVSVYSLGGLILLSIGVIGIYLAKVFDEVKDRPYTVIKNIYK